MTSVIKILKFILVFLVNILVFMFIRHTFKEHAKLLMNISLTFIIFVCLPLGLALHYDSINLTSEPWPIFAKLIDFFMSFLDIHKVAFIAITYVIALVVHYYADQMTPYQTKRDKIPVNELTEELKINTRAVLITMSSALSLILKLLIGVSLVLITIKYSGNIEANQYMKLGISYIFETGMLFLFFDLILFFITKIMKEHIT